MRERRIEIDGVALRCAVDGRSDAPWITLSNSLATNLHLWDLQVEALAREFRVLRYDTRGHGASDAPAGPYSWPMLVGDVVALWDALGVERSHFVGLSMGGMTGLGLALGHADRLESLVCCDCRADAPGFFVDMWEQRQAAVRDGGLAAVLDMTLQTWFTERTRATGGPVVDDVAEMILATPPAGYFGSSDALKTLDYKRRLGEIDTRTLFVVGAEDGPHPAEMESMSALVAGSALEVVADAGHLSNWEQPESFNRALRAFLEGGR